jgi:hypothetical protein
MPEGEDGQILAQALLAGDAELMDARNRHAESRRDLLKRRSLKVVAAQDIGLAGWQARKGRVDDLGQFDRLQARERARSILVRNLEGGGFDGLLGAGRSLKRRSNDGCWEHHCITEFGVGRDATEQLLEPGRGTTDRGHAAAGATRERVLAAQFIEDGTAHAHKAEAAQVALVAREILNGAHERETTCAEQIVAADVQREAARH